MKDDREWGDIEKQNAEHLLRLLAHLIDLGDYDPGHAAAPYNKASLHGIAAVFNRVRRRIAMLERGIEFQSNAFT
ncbi:hypothetical protein [Pseudomonas sp. Irchel s3b2]|uniref:hypothetical protein n=1 Tax=Pseudomonas sp. Irchel s3b2 TaxID=2009073 RepID=UPI000BA4A675|nr:hypothetical protein [Pseudomonas sp. Irchel s3b2]